MRDILLDFSKPKENEQMIEMFAAARTGGAVIFLHPYSLATEMW